MNIIEYTDEEYHTEFRGYEYDLQSAFHQEKLEGRLMAALLFFFENPAFHNGGNCPPKLCRSRQTRNSESCGVQSNQQGQLDMER